MEKTNKNSEWEEKLVSIKNQTVNFIALATVFVALGFIAAALGAWSSYKNGNALSLTNLGTLGSYLQGSVASLWSLAGLLFIYVAFLGQREQLIKQDQELEDQQKQFNLQNESIKLQNFEVSFFQLLNQQNQIVAQLRDSKTGALRSDSLTYERIPMEGRECFEEWYKELKEDYVSGSPLVAKEHMAEFYLQFYQKHQGQFGHYFRNLYHLFKFVNLSTVAISLEDKRKYTSLVRAQLSAYELIFLFYNCITPIPPEKENKFEPLVVKFGLLELLDPRLLLDPAHKKFYTNEAYK